MDFPETTPEIGWRQFAKNWMESAMEFAANADYWKQRAEQAEAAK